jgi:hypothetical protein
LWTGESWESKLELEFTALPSAEVGAVESKGTGEFDNEYCFQFIVWRVLECSCGRGSLILKHIGTGLPYPFLCYIYGFILHVAYYLDIYILQL